MIACAAIGLVINIFGGVGVVKSIISAVLCPLITYLFDNDVAALKHNIVETEKFIASLGQPEERKECNR